VTPRRPSIVIPVALAVAMVVLLAVDHFRQTQPIAVILSSLSLTAALARLVVTQRETNTLLERSRRAALTDALTGLPNRRALLHDLDAAQARGAQALQSINDDNGF
jgi:PleD family two-component response regulator